MPFTVRPARLADALGIANVHRRAVHGLAADYYAQDVLEQWAGPVSLARAERLYREGQAGGAIQFVAELDGEVMGFGVVAPAAGEIVACYVAPEASRRGVGSRLLAEMEGLARQAGCAHLTLRSSTNAKSFYRARGYLEAGRGEYAFGNGVRMQTVTMRKDFV